MQTPTTKRSFFRFSSIVFAAGIILHCATIAFAQSPGQKNPRTNPNSLGTVNLFNGSLNVGMPLLGVSGRGEAGFPLNLRLGRRLDKHHYSWIETPFDNYWTVCSLTSVDAWSYDVCTYADIMGNHFADSGIGTVRRKQWPQINKDGIEYGPGMMVTRVMEANPTQCIVYHPNQPNDEYYLNTVSRLTLGFVTAEGAEHEFVDINTYGKLRFNNCHQYTTENQFNRGNVFVSNDGSGLLFVSDTDLGNGSEFMPPPDTGPPPPGMADGVLYFPNGSRYRFDAGKVSWIVDRNGNKTTFSYTTINNPSGPQIGLAAATDSLNRTVSVEYNVQDVAPFGLCDRITYKGFGGEDKIIRVSKTNLGNVLRADQSILQEEQLFSLPCDSCTAGFAFNPEGIVSALWLPDGTSYKFFYTSWLEVARVEFPTGAASEFDHDYALQTNSYEYYPLARVVTERRLYENLQSTSLVSKTKYSRTVGTSTSATVDVTDANDNLLGRTKALFYDNPRFTPANGPGSLYTLDIPAWNSGLEYQTDSFATDGTTLVGRTLSSSEPKTLAGTLPYDPRPSTKVSIKYENGKALATLEKREYDENGNSDPLYFSHLNLKLNKAYHFKVLDWNTAVNGNIETIAGLFNESDLASVAEKDYFYDANYKARGILGLVSETRVLNPTNTSDVLAKSQFVYDEAAYFDNNYTTTGWEDPNSAFRGNVTTARTWNKDTNTWIESHTMFDNFGNVRKVWDTSGDPTRFVESEYDPVYKYAYSTKTKAPAPDPTGVHGTTEGSEISRVYDFNTGLVTSVTDANGQTATTDYDALLRPSRINPPAGGSVSETIYNDTPGDIWVKSRQQIDENNWAESTTYFDNLGRAYKSRTKDLQGDVMSQVKFDSFGRVEKTSNPYRVDASGNPTETIYWSKPRYDEQNRVVETFAPAPDGQTGMSLGTVEFGISTLPNLIGTYVVSTDASGRKSRAISGIYGVMRVDEATGKGGSIDQDLGTLASPTQPTYYSYNIKGEMTQITQGSQNRYFMYDSFSRLIRVRQPEQTPNAILATSGNPDNNQWTAGYTYDVFGNVASVTDAKNITITNFYDKASRTTKRTYSDGTPQVEYFYDGKGLPSAPQFSKGSLTKVTSSVSEDRFTSFDNHGRLLTSEQITDGQVYPFTYKYNISGGLTEQTYPSGRIVRNFLDTDGGLSSVTTKAAGGLLKQVASDFDYSATGGVRKMKLGNGLWETADVNHLNQLTQVGLGTTATNKDLFKVDYEYGELNTDGTTVDTVKNIGMIAKTTTTVPTTSFVQTFKYDAINRLTEAKETTGANQNWIQTFGYDRYGNRISFSQNVGGVQLPINNITHPTIDQANNRFTTGQGYVYDFNGNLIQDAEGRNFTFNGDDKQTEIRDSENNIIGQYFYDGSGARVKKYVPLTGETTLFVYDAGGALAAEYSTVTPAPEPTTSYLTTDHLGSPRVITDDNGDVIARRDFMPFGEELGVGVGGRSEILKYSITGSDNIRKRFTGYEKDDETGLDFAEARMYQNKHGRFTAPDPLMASASAANPQTFNRYIYTGNNPINYTDPSGLSFCKNNSSGMITWNGEVGKACDSDSTKVDGQKIKLGMNSGGNDSYGNKITPGSTVQFNRDGTTRVVQVSPQNQAPAQGQGVAAASSDTGGQTASEAAAAGASSGSPNGTATEDASSTAGGGASDMLSLPCSPEMPCKTETQSAPRLDSSDAGPLKTIEGAKWFLRLGQWIPGLNVPTTALLIIFEGGQGNGWRALSEVPNLIPGMKWFRKADKGIDAVRAGRTFAERLFLSERFGITSDRFANSYTGLQGAWNKKGSIFKIGWSNTYRKGGGMQLRIGIGGKGNKAWGHIYIPKTFVPNSFANPSMEVKKSLFRLGGL